MILKIKVCFAKRHKAKWRPKHLRQRAKARVLRKRRNKERAKMKWDHANEEEQKEEESKQPVQKK